MFGCRCGRGGTPGQGAPGRVAGVGNRPPVRARGSTPRLDWKVGDQQHISLTPRVTPLEDGVRGWLECFTRTSILGTCSGRGTEAAEIIDEVEDVLRVDCQDTSGNWAIMSTRLRFSAILKAN
ncbi:hypothetical protein GGX14DRAFT_652991 [Mycena pura]|uniref:Uncharacterized protein n=1 Tax=Mycena pura TaxID=153505 RepID=A0AAD6Y8V8_9AGAR|nr:hypothetical protein GGX14DRAFT_652991 [Mycena pura]